MARLRSTFTRPGERERQGEGAQEIRTLTGPPLLRARARPPSRRGMHLLAGGTPLHCVSILVMLVMMLFHVYVGMFSGCSTRVAVLARPVPRLFLIDAA
jgi:hypothetical protein